MDINDVRRALERHSKGTKKNSALPSVVTGRDLPKLKQQRRASFETHIPGEVVENEQGAFFLLKENFPADHQQGFHPLPEHLPAEGLNLLSSGEEDFSEDGPHLAYLDTETTGLAGGAGTFAFLVGLGYWTSKGDFVVEQYFMRDYDEEPAMLTALAECFHEQGFDGVVTYNGRTFDIPLLTARFISNRQRDVISRLPQVDLLFPVRSLWKLRHGDCSLANIEHRVLGVQRTGDVRGEEIPRTYFRFVRGGDPRRLRPVFYHNVQDILSLAALTGKVTAHLASDSADGLDPSEAYSLGRLHLRKGALDKAGLFLERSTPEELPFTIYLRAQKELAISYKQNEQWDKAVELWMQAAQSFDVFVPSADEEGRVDLFAFEELAKYYEHRVKDFCRAREFVVRALDLARLFCDSQTEESLKHRLARLERKQSGAGKKKERD